MARRDWGRNVPHGQAFVHGRNGLGNAIEKQIRQGRGIQPGNDFNRKLRIAITEVISS